MNSIVQPQCVYLSKGPYQFRLMYVAGRLDEAVRDLIDAIIQRLPHFSRRDARLMAAEIHPDAAELLNRELRRLHLVPEA